jgi:Rac GTPase-activating protein 1
MATSTVAQEPSLVAKFDDIVAGVNVLCDGTEDAFVEFLTYHTNMSAKEVGNLKKEICELKGENEAKDIKLKLSRNSLEEQMNECGILKERLKEYEKQFTILKVLLNSDDKQYQLNEAERRSLALLKKINPGISPGYESGGEYPSPDASINVTDATLDDDEGSVSYRTKWKRRRTASVECALESSLSKRKRSIENVLSDKKESVTKYRDSFGLGDEIHMTPPLEQKFKKPQPDKNRRKPSRGHLEKLNDYVAMPTTVPPVVPPLNLPPDTDDIVVIPSAPSEIEVALVDSGGPSSLAYSPQQLMKPEPPYYHEISPLPVTTSIGLYPSLAPPLPMEDMSPHPQGSNSQRKHTFFNKTVVKPETCQVCKKKIRFAKNCFKCKDCRAFCHSDCKDKLSLPCVPNVPTPKKKHKESELSAFCPHSIPRVPSLVVHCVSEIERRGMNQVGLYRIPGSDRSIKELKERLLTARGSPSLDKVEDVNTICGCLKQFLIHLQEPLVTYKMQPAFIQANDSASEKIALAELLEAIAQLPPCNKDTLAFLILHLQR